MENQIKRSIDLNKSAHVLLHQGEPRMGRELGDIFLAACGKIIHTDNLIPTLEKALAEVGADKACPAGD